MFVVITKCDKINGFREFFEGMNQPDEQSQMIGWSNPSPLDEAFQPEQVEQHLEGVRQRLVKRRLKLLEDPIHRGDPTLRRLDEVDSLYLFPDNLASLGTRLRRYLEAIFVAGEWSSMPLFLRGIYFTSALQKGGVVDKALSDALGVDVAAALGEDKESETPYFLRDLFMEKSFKEKGLVTRASNVDNLKRRRKVVLLTAAFAAAIAFGAFMWFGRRQLENAVGDQARFWTAVQQTDADLRIVRGGKYQGGNELNKSKLTLREVHEEGPRSLTKPITIPGVYRPVAFVSGDPNLVRPDAYRALFQNTVFVPLVEETRKRMKDVKAAAWDDRATAALRQLFWLESGQNVDPAGGAGRAAAADVRVRPGGFGGSGQGAAARRVPQGPEDLRRGVRRRVQGRRGAARRDGHRIGRVGRGDRRGRQDVHRVVGVADGGGGQAGRTVQGRRRRAGGVPAGRGSAAESQWPARAGDDRGGGLVPRAMGRRERRWRAPSCGSTPRWPPSSSPSGITTRCCRASTSRWSPTCRRSVGRRLDDLLKAIPSAAAAKSDSLATAQRMLKEARDLSDRAVEAAAKDETRTQLLAFEGGLLTRATGLDNKLQHRYEIHHDVFQRAPSR